MDGKERTDLNIGERSERRSKGILYWFRVGGLMEGNLVDACIDRWADGRVHCFLV